MSAASSATGGDPEKQAAVIVDIPSDIPRVATGTQTAVTIIGTEYDGKQGILKTPVASLERIAQYEVEIQPTGRTVILAGKNMILRKSRKKSTITVPVAVSPVAKPPRKRSILTSQTSLGLGAPIRQPDAKIMPGKISGGKADLSANEEFAEMMKNKGAARKRSTYGGQAKLPTSQIATSQIATSPIRQPKIQVPETAGSPGGFSSGFTRAPTPVAAAPSGAGSEAHDIEVFETFDSNSSGVVQMDELAEILDAAGWSPSFNEIAMVLEGLGLSAAASDISQADFCRVTCALANPGTLEENNAPMTSMGGARGGTESVIEQKRSVYDRVEAQHHSYQSNNNSSGRPATSTKKQLMSVGKQRQEQAHKGFGLQGGHGGDSAEVKKGSRWSQEYEEHASSLAEAAVKVIGYSQLPVAALHTIASYDTTLPYLHIISLNCLSRTLSWRHYQPFIMPPTHTTINLKPTCRTQT
jgi:hypothetical protein